MMLSDPVLWPPSHCGTYPCHYQQFMCLFVSWTLLPSHHQSVKRFSLTLNFFSLKWWSLGEPFMLKWERSKENNLKSFNKLQFSFLLHFDKNQDKRHFQISDDRSLTLNLDVILTLLYREKWHNFRLCVDCDNDHERLIIWSLLVAAQGDCLELDRFVSRPSVV